MVEPVPVLDIEALDSGIRCRVYILVRGQIFPNFDGSRHSLRIRKTVSAIVRRASPGVDTRDTEFAIDDPDLWRLIRFYFRLAED